MEEQLKDKVVKGLFWRFLERCGAQGISFVVSIILARILSPTEFGIISLVTVFTNILMVFTDSGLGQALVQKSKIEDEDYSSALWMNSFLAVALYLGMFFLSPFIAKLYQMEELTSVIRVISLTIIIGGVKGILQAYIQKNMQFKKFFFATLIGTIISAVIGIYMAVSGAGVWALVFQQLTNQVIDTIVLWIVTPCRFHLRFSFNRVKNLYSFGWKILVSHFIDLVYNNMYSLVIGKTYSEADLAYYDKGKQFPYYLINNVNNSINMVMFPTLSKLKNNKEKLCNTVRKSLQVSSFIIFPMMVGFAAIAPDFILVLLTEKWLPAVPFLRFCCFTYALTPIHTANLQAMSAIGRSDIYLKLEIKKKIIGVLCLIITLPRGLYAMMVGRCISGIISMYLNISPNKVLLGYGIKAQMKDLLPATILSAIMSVIVLGLGEFLKISSLMKIIIQIIVGCAVYFGLARVFHLEILEYVKSIVFKKRISD